MKQYMYITRDLDNLQRTERELEEKGIPRSHIQVMSEDEAALYLRNLPAVPDLSKLDIVRYGVRGAMVGAILTTALLAAVVAFDWAQTVGWIPFIFLAMVLLGFCTWEGGLMGVMNINHRFERFKEALSSGAHLLIVDADAEEAPRVESTLRQRPKIHAVH